MLAALAALAAPAAAVRMTHTVSIEGQLVNNWTIDDPEECGPVGSGSLTVRFRSTQTLRVLPFIDRYQRAKSGGYGAWLVVVPQGKDHIKGMPDLRSSGTITRVDNTTRRPLGGSPCVPADKSRCGTLPIGRSWSGIGRYDRRRITVTMATQPFEDAGGECITGALDRWASFALAGGSKPEGELIVRMPKASVLKRRRVVRVTGTSHKRTTLKDRFTDNAPTITNDVTRRATVTFRRR